MYHWSHFLVIALGGALGAMARYSVVTLTSQWLFIKHLKWLPMGFPLGTFLVNVLGCFIIGVVFVVFALKYPQLPGQWRSLIVVGFLGAFTTFSSYSLEALTLMQQGYYKMAAIYLLITVICCIAAVSLGYSSGKLLFN